MADNHLPEESMTGVAWMMPGSVSGEPTVDGGPPPFLVFEPRANDFPYLGAVSIPLALGDRGSRLPPGILARH